MESAEYDRLAAEFYRETGIMAPGKDVPAAMGVTHTMEERRAVWLTWLAARSIRAERAVTPKADE